MQGKEFFLLSEVNMKLLRNVEVPDKGHTRFEIERQDSQAGKLCTLRLCQFFLVKDAPA